MSQQPINTDITYRIAQMSCRWYLTLFHQMKISGEENIPEGGCLIAANHSSFLDPPMIGGAVPRPAYFLARKTLFRPPVGHWLLPRVNSIPVDQENPDMSGLKRIINYAKSGNVVCIFPEGSRSYDGDLLPAQPGVGLVIAKSKVPVVPTRIFGAHIGWPRGRKPRLFTPITLVFGKAIEYGDCKARTKDEYKAIGDEIMQAIAALKPFDGLS